MKFIFLNFCFIRANAVENSYCVLICVTEKYRSSINCQAEAQYAFRLNKPIVPLIMQTGYENVKGWLGIIMGDKIFINFMKYDFDECLKRLKNELDCACNLLSHKPILKESKITNDKLVSFNNNNNNNNKALVVSNKSSLIESWNEQNVIEWFKENNLNIKILEELKPCNGILLSQLYEMKTEAPEFFYQSLKSNQVNLNSLILFAFNLKKLFNKI
jgi:hypothetical protein